MLNDREKVYNIFQPKCNRYQNNFFTIKRL
jgi:hypothetical protein